MRFGVALSIRKGYWLYALEVMPPPQGFSHASFSSSTTTPRPADASRSAAKAPAGPPPRMATRFISSFRQAANHAARGGWLRRPALPVLRARHRHADSALLAQL